jgi:hypothetical protein
MPFSALPASREPLRSAVPGLSRCGWLAQGALSGCVCGERVVSELGLRLGCSARLTAAPAAGIAGGARRCARPAPAVRGLGARGVLSASAACGRAACYWSGLAAMALGGGGDRRPSAACPIHPQQRAGRSPALEQVKKVSPTSPTVPARTAPDSWSFLRPSSAFGRGVFGRRVAAPACRPVLMRPAERRRARPRAPPTLRPGVPQDRSAVSHRRTLNRCAVRSRTTSRNWRSTP